MKVFKRIVSLFAAASISLSCCMSIPASAAQSYEEACEEMLSMINKYRAKEGLNPLKLYAPACQAANIRASECDVKFSHERPNNTVCFTVLDECSITSMGRGENIYRISPDTLDPNYPMDGWMNSEGHRANILGSDYEYVGIGYYSGANGSSWVQIFLTPCDPKMKGDVNGDYAVNAIDASLVLQNYAYAATNPPFEQMESFVWAADVNSDGNVNAVDASKILQYYALAATGKNPTF